jgi:hypothetical protein
MHPLQSDLSKLSDQELENKIIDLTKRYFQVMRFSPSAVGQIVLLLDSYKSERQERELAKAKKSSENGDNELNELIKVD